MCFQPQIRVVPTFCMGGLLLNYVKMSLSELDFYLKFTLLCLLPQLNKAGRVIGVSEHVIAD